MPLISIETNQNIDDTSAKSNSLKAICNAIASLLSKPENYVMLKFSYNPDMLFAGTGEPLAYVELKSLGLPEEKTVNLSAKLSEIIANQFGIKASRIYIEFSSPARHMWGWNGGTF